MKSSRLLISLSIFVILNLSSCTKEDSNQVENNNKKIDNPAIIQLFKDAEIALNLPLFSVMDNSPIPPSGDKHDYYSWSSYLWPNPETEDGLPYIHKDGKINPETDSISDKPLLRRMVMAVNTLALAYQHSKEKKYAEKANQFLNQWFLIDESKMNPKLSYAQCQPGDSTGQPYGVIDTRWFIVLVESIELLEENNGIAKEDATALRNWFKSYLFWLTKSERGIQVSKFENNIGSWYAAQSAAISLFVQDTLTARELLTYSKPFFHYQIDSMGRVVHELTRTKSYDYSLYGINALLSLLKVDQQLSTSIFSEEEKEKVLSAVKFMAKYYKSEEEWPYPQIADKAIILSYEDGIQFSVYYPYDLYYTLSVCGQLFKAEDLMENFRKFPQEEAEKHRSNLLFQEF